MKSRPKIIRATTISLSLNTFCRGLLKELAEDYEVVALSSPDEGLIELSQREGVRTIGVKMARRISPLQDFRSLLSLIWVFWREKPKMVHSMTPKAGLLCMMAAWITRVPVRLHTFTGLVFPTSKGLKRKVLIACDWLIVSCATHVIPEGEGVKQDLTKYVTNKPMRVLGFGNTRGIDLEHYKRQTPMRVTDGEQMRFLFIGRLVGDKGINELIKAFVEVQKRYPKVHLTLVGPEEHEIDPLKDSTLEEIRRNEAIEAVGAQADIRPWMEENDVLVFPSYREGFPNVVIEAGAMDVPSIVTDINGSREIIRHGENGLIIPPQNEDMLLKAMLYMIEHPKERTEMASKTRSMIESRYEQRFVRDCLKDYYREILKS